MDTVVGVIGGIEPARTFVLRALTGHLGRDRQQGLLAAHEPRAVQAAASG